MYLLTVCDRISAVDCGVIFLSIRIQDEALETCRLLAPKIPSANRFCYLQSSYLIKTVINFVQSVEVCDYDCIEKMHFFAVQ